MKTIFPLSTNPRKAAMALETPLLDIEIKACASILSSVMVAYGYPCPSEPQKITTNWVNWAARNVYNYMWVYQYFGELLGQYSDIVGAEHEFESFILPFSQMLTLMPDYITGQPDRLPVGYLYIHKEGV